MHIEQRVHIKKQELSLFFRFSDQEKAIKDFFSIIRSNALEEELYRWFYFPLSEKGKHFADLKTEQVEYFKSELPLLISSLYDYHRSIRKEAHNGA